MAITWQDTRAVAELLFERYDTLDPRTVRLPDMRKWCLDLEDFAGKPDEPGEAALEAIRQAWGELWGEEYGEG